MFKIFKTIARTVNTALDDIASVRNALVSLGYHDDSDTGFSPYADDIFFIPSKIFKKTII